MGTERSVRSDSTGPASSQRRSVGWAAAGITLLAVVLVVLFWDWNWFRPFVAAQASAALGRPVTLQHFDLHPGRETVAIADGVAIANPPGFGSDIPFMTIDRLTVTIDILAYLHGRQIVIPSIVVEHPVVAAEESSQQSPNWLFPNVAVTPAAGTPPKLGDLQINDGHAHVLVPRMKSDFTMDIATTDPDAHGDRRIKADARGTYAGQPITGKILAGALLSLRDAASPYPIDLQMQAGNTRVSLIGSVQDPLSFAGANLKLRLAGSDMSQLYLLTGIPIPKTPSYEIAGDLDYSSSRIVLRDIAGKVGSTDLEGDLSVDPHTVRPLVTADLRSRQVDLADLGGFIGSQPGRLSTPNQTPEERAALARAEASPQLLPTKAIDLPTLRSADVHLKYHGAHIIGRSVPFDSITTVMAIDDGRIRLAPLSVAIGAGRLEGHIDLTPMTDRQIRLQGDVAVQRIDLHRLLQAAGVASGKGLIGGRAVIDSTGNSVATFAGNGDGSVQLVMSGGGEVSALLVDLSGLEFGNSLLAALGLPRRDQIECFIGDFTLKHGILSTRTVLLDTTDNIVTGTGSANFRNEVLDFKLKTEAKHFSIGTLPAPIGITGPFKKPSIGPDVVALGVRGGAAVGLGFLFPPAALLPTIQFGVGDDQHCAAAAHIQAPVKK